MDPFKDYKELYSERNWDGFDADPITPETINAATELFNALPFGWTTPEVAPGVDGVIGFEWLGSDSVFLNADSKVFIDVGPGRIWSAYWRGQLNDRSNLVPQKMDNRLTADLKEFLGKCK